MHPKTLGFSRAPTFDAQILVQKIGPRDLVVIYPKLRTPLLWPTIHVHLFTFLWYGQKSHDTCHMT